MRIAVSLTASVAVHVAVVLALAIADEPGNPHLALARTARPDAPAPHVEVVPIEVVLLPTPPTDPPALDDVPPIDPPIDPATPPAPTAATTPHAPAVPGPATAAMTDRTGTAPVETAPGPVGPAAPDGTRLMTMRRPGDDIALAPGAHRSALERIAAAGKPLPVDPTTGELAPDGGGRAVGNETVFTAHVNRDGTVAIEDARNLRLRLDLPRPSKVGKAVGDHLEEWAKDPYRLARKGGEPRPPRLTNPDFQVDEVESRDHPVVLPVGGADFDINDALERWAGNDPYASRKLSFMDRTRDERVLMGERERKRQRDATEQTVRRHLTRLWGRADLSLAQKKEALFELWDDCAESDDPGDAEAGSRARAHVVGFIRGRLPAGGEHAYTAAELAELDARRKSKAHFAPYP